MFGQISHLQRDGDIFQRQIGQVDIVMPVAAATQAKGMAENKAQALKYTLRESGPDAIGTLCGGNVTVFIEPYLPQPVLLIVGDKHSFITFRLARQSRLGFPNHGT